MAKPDAGYGSYCAAPRHVARKVSARDTNAHTTLDQGISRLIFAYL